MITLVRDAAFVMALLVALTFLVTLFTYKRPDMSLSAFLIAGPLIILRPSRYLRTDRRKIPPLLFALTMLLFVVVWFATWIINNS